VDKLVYATCFRDYNIDVKRGPKPKGQVLIRWSREFAYAIGLLTSDGCLSKNGRHINLTSKDLEQLKTFKKCLCLNVKIGIKYSGNGSGRPYYQVQFGDVLFYKFLNSIGLFSAKSKTISSVLVPDEYFADFLRGYFDGDGSSYSYYDSLFPKSYRFYISFMSASPSFVRWLQTRISKMIPVKGHFSGYTDSNYLQLKYAKTEAIIVSRYMYYGTRIPFLKRKYLKIQRTMRIIGSRCGGDSAPKISHWHFDAS